MRCYNTKWIIYYDESQIYKMKNVEYIIQKLQIYNMKSAEYIIRKHSLMMKVSTRIATRNKDILLSL